MSTLSMKRFRNLGTLLLVILSLPHANATTTEKQLLESDAARKKLCKGISIQSARESFQGRYKKGDYDGAASELLTLTKQCVVELFPGRPRADAESKKEWEAYYWLLSDLTLGLYKAKRYSECLAVSLGATESDSRPFDDLEVTKAGKALMHNEKACQAEREKALRLNFTSESCTLKIPINGSGAAVSVPKSWGLSPARGTCVMISSATEHAGSGEGEGLGPESVASFSIQLVGITQANKMVRTPLKFEGGDLESDELCWMKKLELGGDAKRHLIRIGDSAGFCGGGTGRFILDSVYQLQNASLRPFDEMLVATH